MSVNDKDGRYTATLYPSRSIRCSRARYGSSSSVPCTNFVMTGITDMFGPSGQYINRCPSNVSRSTLAYRGTSPPCRVRGGYLGYTWPSA